ncbi:MAG TPA: patatin-like phospholipase family protein [Chitinophagaceae bacterium]|nr:patatin-like phospholipase family protein [Chitinophagaceae bacterium]
MKKSRILSIDGGGIRGIIPATILLYLEKQLKIKTGKDRNIGDWFDMIAGTSTGGILACIYLIADFNGKARYSAEEALNLYLKDGPSIFQLNELQEISSGFGLLHPKYSNLALCRLLVGFFQNMLMSDIKKPYLITSYDIENRKSVLFCYGDDNKDSPIALVTQATAAAPTYFAPLPFGDTQKHMILIDGGMVANNPTMCTYVEAQKTKIGTILNDTFKKDNPDIHDMLIVSLDTGNTKLQPYTDMQNAGEIKWVKPLFDIMMSTSSEIVDYQVRKEFEGTDQYYRIASPLINASPVMDDAEAINIEALHQDALNYISGNEAILDEVMDQLIEND